MGSFNRDDRSGGFRGGFNRGGGRGGFSSRGRSAFGRGGDRGNREMFKTTCSNCGKECEVPFRPTNGKPVYCSDCFEKMGNGDRRDAPRNDFRSPSPVSNQNNAQIDAINTKLEAMSVKIEKILAILEPKRVESVMPDLVVEEVKTPKIKKVVKKTPAKK